MHKEYNKEYYQKHKERIKEAVKKDYQKNKEARKAQKKEKYQRTKDLVWENNIQKKYGISKEDYDEILKSQNGGCAICGTDKQVGRGRLHVDHCHTSNKVRGILCSKCNAGIGQLNDSIELLSSAIKYLEDSR